MLIEQFSSQNNVQNLGYFILLSICYKVEEFSWSSVLDFFNKPCFVVAINNQIHDVYAANELQHFQKFILQ